MGIFFDIHRVSEEWLVASDGDVHGALMRTPVPDDESITMEPGSEMLQALIADPENEIPAVDGGELMPLGDDVPPVLALAPWAVQKVAWSLEQGSFEERLRRNRPSVEAAFGGDCTEIIPDLRARWTELRDFYGRAARAEQWVIKVF